MKRNIFPSLLIIALLFTGIGGQLAVAADLPVYASSPTSFGMWERLSSTDSVGNEPYVSWYANSEFDWIMIPYWTQDKCHICGREFATQEAVAAHIASVHPIIPPTEDWVKTFTGTLSDAGKKVILRTMPRQDFIEVNHYNWTDIYNSLNDDKSIYNAALGNIVTQINEVGVETLYAITIGEEEPNLGYWFNNSAVNVEYFIAAHNQMYDDLKAQFPGIRVFAFVNIEGLTDAQMATLKRDGLFGDAYQSDIEGIMKPWFQRMMRLGGEETYCIVWASNSADSWYDSLTPAAIKHTAEIAQSVGVPHIGWFATDFTASPEKSILLNNWPACSNLNDPHCSGNLKNTILDIVNGVQPTPTPTPTLTPTPTPTSTPTPTPTATPTSITGDANGDGIVNSTDLTKVERIIMMLDPVTSSADVNGDGNINALDLTQIELIIMRG